MCFLVMVMHLIICKYRVFKHGDQLAGSSSKWDRYLSVKPYKQKRVA